MRPGLFQRAVGRVVLGTAGGAAGLLWFAVAAGDPTTKAPEKGLLFGVWTVFYDTQAPASRVILAAAALVLLLAAGVALIERRITTRSRRSLNRQATPLAPRVVMAATRGPMPVRSR